VLRIRAPPKPAGKGRPPPTALDPGLAIKNPPKNTNKKKHLRKPTKNGFFGFFWVSLNFKFFYENNTNFSF
jgi:hypothetical protein